MNLYENIKKNLKESETIGDLLDEIDNAYSIGEIESIGKRFKNEMDRKTIEDEVGAIEEEYGDVYDMDEDSEEYASILDELKSCISSDFSGEEENINESEKLKEADYKIWSNHGQEEYYENMSREEMLEEIKANGWDEEEINGEPILNADDEDLRAYLTPYDLDLDYEDYENSILPMIEDQCYNDELVLTGIAANWRGKGSACKAIKTKDLENYFFPNYDATIQLYCNGQDDLYYTEANHDTPMGGTEMYLYSFKDETSYNNAEKLLQELYEDEDWDMYYFDDWAGCDDVQKLIEHGFLTPVKRNPQYVGRVNESESLKDISNKDDILIMYNPSLKKEIKLIKKDNKWLDDSGKVFAKDISIDELRSRFAGDWKRIMSTDESESLKESSYALEPKHDHAQSFYGKARVEQDGDAYTLISYITPILRVENGKLEVLCDEEAFSQTTMRHVREFLQQMEEEGKLDLSNKDPKLSTKKWLLSLKGE